MLFGPDEHIAQLGLFSESMMDNLAPLHVAALLGDDLSVRDPLKTSNTKLLSVRLSPPYTSPASVETYRRSSYF
jgi:hypothetical protein